MLLLPHGCFLRCLLSWVCKFLVLLTPWFQTLTWLLLHYNRYFAHRDQQTRGPMKYWTRPLRRVAVQLVGWLVGSLLVCMCVVVFALLIIVFVELIVLRSFVCSLLLSCCKCVDLLISLVMWIFLLFFVFVCRVCRMCAFVCVAFHCYVLFVLFVLRY